MPKTILLTGATDGIGLAAARTLAAQGHRLLIHGRSAEKLAAVLAELGPTAKGHLADLSQVSQVAELARDILAEEPRLDVLINNAGVLKAPVTKTPDGLDLRFVVNTLAPYLLCKQLLPIMPADGRILNLSSAAQAPVAIPALMGQEALADMEAYAQSKLALTMFSRHLAQTLPEGPVVIAINPGSLLATNMVREGFGISGNDLSIGAEILSRAASDPEFASATGLYFDNDAGRFGPPHTDALDDLKCAQVVEALDKLVAPYLSRTP